MAYAVKVTFLRKISAGGIGAGRRFGRWRFAWAFCLTETQLGYRQEMKASHADARSVSGENAMSLLNSRSGVGRSIAESRLRAGPPAVAFPLLGCVFA